MHVTVNKHRGLVAMGIATPPRAGECVLDGALAARPVEFLPHVGDELGKPPRLLGPGRQAALSGRAPDACGSGDEDLVSAAGGQPQLME